MIGRRIEAKRIQHTTYTEISAFFDRFQRTIAEHDIRLEDIWNMDEHGIALGVCTNSRVLASSSKKRAYVAAPQDREWVSIIEVVSAIGKKCRPVIIFKGTNLLSTWFEEDVLDWVYTTLENGWTSNQISYGWLERVFLPETKREGRPRLLLLDGHGSHVSIDFMWILKQNNVWPV